MVMRHATGRILLLSMIEMSLLRLILIREDFLGRLETEDSCRYCKGEGETDTAWWLNWILQGV